MELVSVIVPIYNVEDYLCQCLDSIINQTYTNLEIILVDDGSPDNCPAICDKYAEKDSRIKVIHKENGGLSDARNAGIAVATGTYLMFVDSDDWMQLYTVEKMLYIAINTNADLVIGGIKRIDDETGKILFSNCDNELFEKIIDKSQAMLDMLQHGWGPWARLYRKSIHEHIEFPYGKTYEDEAIALALLERCDIIVKTNIFVYNYRCRPESITTSAFSEKNLIWYENCKNDVDWIMVHHPELYNVALLRYYGCIQLHILEIALASKQYHPLAIPLLREMKDKYQDILKVFKDNGKSTVKIKILRHMPYGLYCNLIRIYYFFRYRKVI